MTGLRRLSVFWVFVFAVVAAVAAATEVSVSSSDNLESAITGNGNGNGNGGDDDDDNVNSRYYIPHEGNSTLSATFSIRVTPEHYHIISWALLWAGFVSAILLGMHQIRLERKWLKHVLAMSRNTGAARGSSAARSLSSSRLRKYSVVSGSGGSPQDPELGGGGGGGMGGGGKRTSRGGRIVRSSRVGSGNNIGSGFSSSSSRMTLSTSTTSLGNSSNPVNLGGDEHPVSSGDLARATFRRLILIAMASRALAIPIQVYSDPLWVQLIADTFPVMTYATAWTWLVSFFVQLVGVALGSTNNIVGGTGATTINSSGTSGSPSNAHRSAATIDTVIQITAYVVYSLLIIAFTIFRRIAAAVLLYALLCCIYATLLGTALYFFPRLLSLLLPGLEGKWHSPLALRLVACSVISLLVFAARTFCFAKKVVQSTTPLGNTGGGPYWWFQYGALELLPGIMFLILLYPKQATTTPNSDSSRNTGTNITKSASSGRTNHHPASGAVGYGSGEDPSHSGRRTPPLHSSYQRSDSNDSKSGARNPSPQPSRSPPPSTQQATNKVSNSNPNHEKAPLLASNSSRYGGSAIKGGDAGVPIDVILNHHHQQQQQLLRQHSSD